MHWFRFATAVVLLGSVSAACSSEGAQSDSDGEATAQVAQAITAACGPDTIGLPCDPDGPAKPKLECEGVCAIALNGLVTCAPVAAGTLDGIICGTISGVGDNACKRHCSGKACLALNAPDGAACRPTAKSNPCEGQCNGAGKCDNLGGSACAFGRTDQLCKFEGCNFKKATQCTTKNLTRGTLCSDTNACSIGSCDAAGVCVAGPTVGCDDGNSCTDESCDPKDGGCVGVNNDANPCSDGNACFTGEHCTSGACIPGTIPVVCEDNNACTSNACDPNTGCAFVPKSCDDANACTVDDCDPLTGACSHKTKVCNDGNDCTDDSCNTATGCVFTAKDCDDADACTADSCALGACGHEPVSCNDDDPCTTDSCAAATGCVFTAVPDCGAGGGGGAGGTTGAGGETSTGGTGEGGEPAAGGLPGVGGDVADGGDPTGGTPNVGGSQAAGTASTTGGATGGSQSDGGTSTAGSATEGGSVVVAEGSPRVNESSGCGCRTVATPTGHLGAIAMALLGATVVLRRRRTV